MKPATMHFWRRGIDGEMRRYDVKSVSMRTICMKEKAWKYAGTYADLPGRRCGRRIFAAGEKG